MRKWTLKIENGVVLFLVEKGDENQMYKKSGSYTVEAALLYTLVIMIIVGIICTCFVMHDRGVVYTCMAEFAEKEVSVINSGGSIKDSSSITDEIYEECCKHMFVSDVENISCDYRSDNVTICAEITTNVPIFKHKEIKVKQYASKYTDKVRFYNMVN